MSDLFSNEESKVEDLELLYGKCKNCGGEPKFAKVQEFDVIICGVCNAPIKTLRRNDTVIKVKTQSRASHGLIRKPTTKQIIYNDVPQPGKWYNENNLSTMARMPNEYIDLIVTSPPYDNLREYEGIVFDYKKIFPEMYRVLKIGGVLVWIVNDQTFSGNDWNKQKENPLFEAKSPGESLTSLRHALFAQECGFWVWDTMTYDKPSPAYPPVKEDKRYGQVWEYMFVFTKGEPKTVNLLADRRNITAGSKSRSTGKVREEFGIRYNKWEYMVGVMEKGKDKAASLHPAVFPDKLPLDHIQTWTNEGDLVYDPFLGSGTTMKVAAILKRQCIGSELSTKYCEEIIPLRVATLTLDL